MEKMSNKIIYALIAVIFIVCIATGQIGFLNTKADTGKGSVYYLNFKPEQDQAWQELAKYYTQKTGVPVTVVTAASGQYMTTLAAELSKIDAPTLFQVQGPSTLNGKEDFCYDLATSNIYKELTDEVYVLKSNKGKVCGIAYTIESYGLIANLKLLEKAGYTKNSIKSFNDLKKIAEDITSRKNELGFAAFCSSGMDNSSNWRFVTHLANMPLYFEYKDKNLSIEEKIDGKYLNNYKAMWDLYINNSTCEPKEISAKTADDARNEFLAQKAVFYQNGSWEFANLVSDKAFKPEDIAMLPIFIGVGDEAKQGLCTGTENFWCVNQKVSKSDIEATLDFINWCVTSEEGTKAMAEKMGFVIPFKKALETENVFVVQNNNYSKEGKSPVPWSFTTIPSQEWKNMLNTALIQYAANQTEENWKEVSKAFINNWEYEFKLANGM